MALPTIDPLVWRVIGAGLWRQHESWDGTYDVGDLVDALEYLDIKAENERRLREAMAHAERG